MKRRLSVALSFLGKPKIMFLDEPTTGTYIYECNTICLFVPSVVFVCLSAHHCPCCIRVGNLCLQRKQYFNNFNVKFCLCLFSLHFHLLCVKLYHFLSVCSSIYLSIRTSLSVLRRNGPQDPSQHLEPNPAYEAEPRDHHDDSLHGGGRHSGGQHRHHGQWPAQVSTF